MELREVNFTCNSVEDSSNGPECLLKLELESDS